MQTSRTTPPRSAVRQREHTVNFALKMVHFASKLMNFVFKMINSTAHKEMRMRGDFVFKMTIFVFKTRVLYSKRGFVQQKRGISY